MNIEQHIADLEAKLGNRDHLLEAIKSGLHLLVSHHGAVAFKEGGRMDQAFKWLFLTGIVNLKPTASPDGSGKYFEAIMFNHIPIELQEKAGIIGK